MSEETKPTEQEPAPMRIEDGVDMAINVLMELKRIVKVQHQKIAELEKK